jgi:hypothetical protein
MEEWVISQFVRTLEDYGLKKPWYWDEFIEGLEWWHHALHLGVWCWRPTVWWNPQPGVSGAERQWLCEKYPKWEATYGPIWDQIATHTKSGHPQSTLPETLPWLCTTCHLPQCAFGLGTNGKNRMQDYTLVYDGHPYYFCSRVCRDIWKEDRDMLHVRTLVERLLAGEVQPPHLLGLFSYMGLTPDVMAGYPDRSWPGELIMSGPQSIPINARFGEDFVSHLVVIAPADTMDEVARKVARHAVGKRIAPQNRPMRVYYEGHPVAREATVTQVGIESLQQVFVDYERT